MRYRDLTWDLHEKGDCFNGLCEENYDLSAVSLSSSYEKIPKAVKRIHEIFEQPTFMERIQGGDITQDNLSDC
ncbi:Calpain catalytic domain-containing protein [Fusarium sp. Ph1]|nr:Calpain catalytic domain-containing protein [Fusarium sp. Ph1]